MTATAAPRRRGRPPLDWLDWAELADLPDGTAVVVDQGEHRPRLRARVSGRSADGVWVRARSGETVLLTEETVVRARIVEALFEPGDPVLLAGVPERRGGVVRTSRDGTVRVETLTGFEDLHEDSLQAPEDRVTPRRALKPGPIAADPAVEAANQAAYRGRRRTTGRST